jgi:hypothetical protein
MIRMWSHGAHNYGLSFRRPRRTYGSPLHFAWLCATPDPVSKIMIELLVDVVGQQLAEWLRDVPWHNGITGHSGLVAWLVDFLELEPRSRAQLVALVSG